MSDTLEVPDVTIKERADERLRVTFRQEKIRAVASGIAETAGTTFVLLIAVRWYEAGPTAKGLLTSGSSLGLLLCPFAVYFAQRFGIQSARAAAVLWAFGALSFFAASIFTAFPVFVIASTLGVTVSAACVPFYAQIYQENYPQRRRGRLYSATTMIRIFWSVVFAAAAGQYLSGRIDAFPLLLLLYAIALGIGSSALSKCPSRVPGDGRGPMLFHGFKYLRSDRMFRMSTISWMLYGSGTFLLLPQRVDYLANPKYGLNMSEAYIALLVGVVPNMARLIFSPLWGEVFDRTNFFVLRIVLNIVFLISVLSFFFGESLAGLFIGAAVYGASQAGGEIAWGLWVTKFAPEERVADYMSVHTFFTGIRGVVMPIVGFHLASIAPLAVLGIVSTSFIVLASLLLIPEIRQAPTGLRAREKELPLEGEE